ncbi:hypothetical protein GCM10009863_27430 [Streptomyces axinellae]|uniref:Uncharacterized protein n=1 Tax=Streptomyces axinellae TaxID=552788 RepID=A0ABN3Q1A7_9ACTN
MIAWRAQAPWGVSPAARAVPSAKAWHRGGVTVRNLDDPSAAQPFSTGPDSETVSWSTSVRPRAWSAMHAQPGLHCYYPLTLRVSCWSLDLGWTTFYVIGN